MDTAYALNYKDLYYRHWWWRARESLILSTIEKIRNNRTKERILDVGCGDGLLFDQLSQFGDVEGVEREAALVSTDNPWRTKISICPFDGRFRPYKKFTLILMLDVLEHSSDAQSILQHALDLLDDNGFIVITAPAFPCLWTSHDDLNNHFKRYTKQAIRHLASQSGMKLVSCHYFFNWTFAVKLCLNLKERCFGSNPRIPTVPPSWVNEVLFWVSVVEQRVFRNTPIPFGSSLIAVGTKR